MDEKIVIVKLDSTERKKENRNKNEKTPII
jgi:hypothetical protein